jgi:hypothetical protein
VLYDEFYSHLEDNATDSNGYYQFDALDIGDYYVEVYSSGHAFNYTMITIDYEGEGELVEFYNELEYTAGMSYIEVYVYDNDTLSPINNAQVRLFYELDNSQIDMDFTDSSGFKNFTGHGYGEYRIEATATGYTMNSSLVFIDYDGEGEYLLLYIPPVVRTLDILSPTDSQTVEGGSVLVEYSASDSSNLDYIDVYVDAGYVTTLSIMGSPYTECIIPVFENGTNTILLEGHWYDASIGSDSVDINSVNVIPIAKIREDDIYNSIQVDLFNAETYEYNFTFIAWISTFEMYTQFDLHQYNSTHTILQDTYYLTINVLNGYVSTDTSGMMMLYNHFFPFGCILPSPSIGDKLPWVPWNQMILHINGSKQWKYTEVWTVTDPSEQMVMYFEKSTNLLYYISMLGFIESNVLVTTVDFLQPQITDLTAFSYDEGDTGNILSWNATDMHPGTYTITNNTVEIKTGTWTSETNITISIDGLPPGTYTFRINITDVAGNTAADIVTVTVNPVVTEMNPILCLIFLPMTIMITYVVFRKRRS